MAKKYTKKEYTRLKRRLARVCEDAMAEVRKTVPDANLQFRINSDLEYDFKVTVCAALVDNDGQPEERHYWPFPFWGGEYPDDDVWPRVACELVDTFRRALENFHHELSAEFNEGKKRRRR